MKLSSRRCPPVDSRGDNWALRANVRLVLKNDSTTGEQSLDRLTALVAKG